MVNILVIGIGNIGIRHVEALAKIKIDAKVFILSRYEDSIHKAITNYVNSGGDKQRIQILKSINDLTNHIDIAVLSTNSDERFSIFKKLVYKIGIKNFILEKFVFNQIEQYDRAKRIINSKNLNVWINHSFRQFNVIKEVKNYISKLDIKEFSVKGNYGLSCNITHWLDLFTFITEKKIISLDGKLLDDNIISSKRFGYIEFTGSISGKAEGGVTLNIIQEKDCKEDITIEFKESTDIYVRINITEQLYVIKRNEIYREKEFPIEYQSKLTNFYVEDIINNGTCRLPKFQDIYEMNLLVLKVFLDKLGLSYNEKCYIT